MKVVNWVFGSFFRTIGRTIALFVMAGIIYYLLASSGIDIKNLFLDKVNAEELVVPIDEMTSGYVNFSNTNQLTCTWDACSRQIYSTTNNNINEYTWEFDNFGTSSWDYIGIPFSLSQPITITQTDSSDIRYCTRYECTQYCASGNCAGMCETYTCTSYKSMGTSNTVYSAELKDMSFTIMLNFNNNTFSYCQINGNMITCPVNKRQVTSLVIKTNFRTAVTTTAQFTINRAINLYSKGKTNQDIINNQNQNTQSIINQQQNSTQQMLDSNTTQAESEASDFFGNFTQSDHGGLNSIVTAPLNTIRSLLSNSCTNLVLPLPFVNENITLPCMNDIYTTHFGLFFSLYQTIILAIISYRCIRSIFFDIHGFTDPDDDRIEVMDL